MNCSGDVDHITTQDFLPQPSARKSLPFGVIDLKWNGAERGETYCNGPQQTSVMPVLIENIRYFYAIEIYKELRVSRTTFWRWRADGSIPNGKRYRGKRVVFNEEELAAIREYADRLEPTEPVNRSQMKLFNGVS